MSKSAVAQRPADQDAQELDIDTTGKAKTKPIASGKYGRIEWALFPQERTRVDGSSYTTLQCVLDKSWPDQNGAWHHRRITLNNPREMMAVRIAMDDAFKALYNTSADDEE
jgi:hypothetical protein